MRDTSGIAERHTLSQRLFRADEALYMAVAKVVLLDMFNSLAPEDKQYFRTSREEKFGGQTLEEVSVVTRLL